jgi:hypothetical protein
LLKDDASTLDAIKAADEKTMKEFGKFPVEEFKSLFQMVYHPIKNRFCSQVQSKPAPVQHPSWT